MKRICALLAGLLFLACAGPPRPPMLPAQGKFLPRVKTAVPLASASLTEVRSSTADRTGPGAVVFDSGQFWLVWTQAPPRWQILSTSNLLTWSPFITKHAGDISNGVWLSLAAVTNHADASNQMQFWKLQPAP